MNQKEEQYGTPLPTTKERRASESERERGRERRGIAAAQWTDIISNVRLFGEISIRKDIGHTMRSIEAFNSFYREINNHEMNEIAAKKRKKNRFVDPKR